MRCRSFCLVRPMRATSIWRPMSAHSARWTAICVPIWTKITPYSRRGKDFSTYIVCEFEDDVEHNSFVCGVMFDCRSDGSKHDHFFIYVGKLPENCFVEDGEAMDIHDLRKFLKQNFSRAEVYAYPVGVPPQYALGGGTCTTSRCSA